MKRLTALLTAVIAIGVLAGCSEKTGGNANTTAPTTGEQTGSTPTSSGSSTGLSIAKFVDKPCDLVTAAQLPKLGSVRAPETASSTIGPRCDWKGQDVIKNSTYRVAVTKDKSVEDMIANVKNSAVFTDHKVDGIRFVTYDATDASIDCRTIIEVSDTDSVTSSVSIASAERAAKKPCTESEVFAKMIVETLKG
ncbi:DUF3558 domain-containing protein [Lentzea sp. BCCO 10_0856]|uniref:DUF3558 domain-containing protein n=1 Tax=Lentzea miocenica TaxID=3095431 RepID=A0ABU4T7R7_9PSEU|nr:DUF3558 domain-containing protein [Lentzea sp. BCCO 10_0856]MDX8034002.1 DUF3558 domain-containing protein [Lentzea sp. BCCO 10_0856]